MVAVTVTGVQTCALPICRFRATGVQPKILDRLRVSGIPVPPGIFEEVVNVNL
jgi:hypothetical protein